MKKSNKKLALSKIKISKLSNSSLIVGGSEALGGDDPGTLRSWVPTRCKGENGNE